VWVSGARIGVAPEGRGVLDALLAELVADSLVSA
jgi:oxygen-independent coproporphyrinogen-3 oxidase